MATVWNLENLGWKSFQNLCGSILHEVFGQTAQMFEDGNDAGRDGAFFGEWRDDLSSQNLTGAFVVQAKFSQQDATLSRSDIENELTKIPRLIAEGICDNYILITNARVTAKSNQSIREAILALGVRDARIWSRPWLIEQLERSANLRRLVPRLYGLGDLSYIQDERRQEQARAVLAYLGPAAETFVETSTYLRALNALQETGVVLLLGGPTVGKSVIAQMLTLGAIDAYGNEPLKVSSAEDFVATWNADSPIKRVYWIDDVFGDLELSNTYLIEWLRRMPELMAARAKGSRFIFTSRDYIYRQAQPKLKESSYPLWRDSRIEVEVAALTEPERERILYNHLKMGNQDKRFKTAIKRSLEKVARANGFTPGLAARLGNKAFTDNLNPANQHEVLRFFEEPTEYLSEIFGQLSTQSRATMGVVYSYDSRLLTPTSDSQETALRLAELGGHLSQLDETLEALNNTFLHGSRLGHHTEWTFAHPTIRQATATYLQKSTGAVRALVNGTPPAALPSMIDLRPQAVVPQAQVGRYISVPPALHRDIVDRLSGQVWATGVKDSGRGPMASHDLASLVLRRSTRDFRSDWVSQAENQIKTWSGMSFTYFRDVIGALALLHRDQLLAPEVHKSVADRIRAEALTLADPYWIGNDDVIHLLTQDGYTHLIEEVRSRLSSQFDDYVMQLELDWQTDSDPEGYLESSRSMLDDMKQLFAEDANLLLTISDHEERLLLLEEELRELYTPDVYEEDDDDQWRAEEANSTSTAEFNKRSVFDDVDA